MVQEAAQCLAAEPPMAAGLEDELVPAAIDRLRGQSDALASARSHTRNQSRRASNALAALGGVELRAAFGEAGVEQSREVEGVDMGGATPRLPRSPHEHAAMTVKVGSSSDIGCSAVAEQIHAARAAAAGKTEVRPDGVGGDASARVRCR